MPRIADSPSIWGDPLQKSHGKPSTFASVGGPVVYYPAIPASEGNPGVGLHAAQAERLLGAADFVLDGFGWALSREGDAFWRYVHQRLEEMAREKHS